jgi:hypothetical protein
MSSHSSRRMSLGTGAQRRVLGEGSSRFNTRYGSSNLLSSAVDNEMNTPQKSLYDGSNGGLGLDLESITDGGENASVSSTRRSSSVPRRQSFGGEGLLSAHRQHINGNNSGETPVRDRRAMLQAWRQAREGDSSSIDATRKRTARGDPLLPPSSKHPKVTMPSGSSNVGATLPHEHRYTGLEQMENRSHQSALNYYDDDEENRTIGGSSHILFSARTPSSRRAIGSARRKSILGRSVVHSNEGKSKTSAVGRMVF